MMFPLVFVWTDFTCGEKEISLTLLRLFVLAHKSSPFSRGGVNEERAHAATLLNECFVTPLPSPLLFSCRKTLSPNEMNVVGQSKVSLAAFISPHKEIFFVPA